MDLNAAMETATAAIITAIGEDWTYSVDGVAAAVPIKADFTDESKNLELSMGPIGSTDPQIMAATRDVSGVNKSSVFTRTKTGQQYTMRASDPDGTGGTLITLTKA